MKDATNKPLLKSVDMQTSDHENESDNVGSTPDTMLDAVSEDSESSNYSYIMDPDATEEDLSIYEQSGVSLTYLHGVFYTPPEFKKVRSQSRLKRSQPKASAASVDHDIDVDSNMEEKEINIPAKKKLKVDNEKCAN